jgi:hypothetical protein
VAGEKGRESSSCAVVSSVELIAVLVECAARREEELGEERLVAGVEGMMGSGMR